MTWDGRLSQRVRNAVLAITFYEARLDNAPTLDEVKQELTAIAVELERTEGETDG